MWYSLTILYIVLLTSVTGGVKNCNDCVRITDCEQALKLIRRGHNPTTVTLLKDAFCGFEQRRMKVCCLHFSDSQAINKTDDELISHNEITDVDEIETHPSIKLLPEQCGDLDGDRIIGGTIASLYEFPWIALVLYRHRGVLRCNCEGTVINAKYVLTAAHCIRNKVIAAVRIGDYDISQINDCVGRGRTRECESKYQEFDVSLAIYHEDYVKTPVVLNDIGLLQLSSAVDFSYRNAATICLPLTRHLQEMDLSGERATVAGWGITENGQTSNILLKVQVPIHSAETCNTYYTRYNKNLSIYKLQNTLCAGENGRDSCKGDSGSPLMVKASYNHTYRYVQFGIVSYGPLKCGRNRPGTYTDVRKFMKWILDNIRP